MAANADGIITRLYFFPPSPPPLPPSPPPFHVHYIVRLIDCHTDWITPLFLLFTFYFLLLTLFFLLYVHIYLYLFVSRQALVLVQLHYYSFPPFSFSCSSSNFLNFELFIFNSILSIKLLRPPISYSFSLPFSPSYYSFFLIGAKKPMTSLNAI